MRKMMITVATVVMVGALSTGAAFAVNANLNAEENVAVVEAAEENETTEAKKIEVTPVETKKADTKKDIKETAKKDTKNEVVKSTKKSEATGYEKYFAINGVSTAEEIAAMGPDAFAVSDEEWVVAKAQWMELNPEYSEEVAESTRGEYETAKWLEVVDHYGVNPYDTAEEAEEVTGYEEYFAVNGVSTAEEIAAMGPDAFAVSDEEWAVAKAQWMELNPEFSEEVAESTRGEYETAKWLEIVDHYGVNPSYAE